MSKDVSEVLRECRRVAEARAARGVLRFVRTQDITTPDPDAEPRDTLRVNCTVRNPAINGGSTEEWMREFGFAAAMAERRSR
jgi:hypothetical protein